MRLPRNGSYRRGITTAHPGLSSSGGFLLRLGMHAVDHTFTEVWLDLAGVNISISATVDAKDKTQLTIVAKPVPTVRPVSSLGDAGDLAMLLIPRFTNGRTGVVLKSNESITGTGTGLRTSQLVALQGASFHLPSIPINSSVDLPSVYLGIELDSKVPAVSCTYSRALSHYFKYQVNS